MKIREKYEKPLSLVNDGRLSLFFIGVGSAFTKRQFQTNLLIIKGDTHLLIDCGTLAPLALHQLGTSVMDINNLYITHSHADHIGGLEELTLMHRYVRRDKPNIIICEAYQTILWEMSLRGGCAHNEDIGGGEILKFSDMFSIIRPTPITELPRCFDETTIGSLNIKTMRTKHIPDSSDNWENSFWSKGLVIDDRVFFTSDTRFDPELIELVESNFSIETIFHDCRLQDIRGVHATLEELSALPDDIKAKMFLVHYEDAWEEHEETVRKRGFGGLTRQQQFYDFG